MDIPVPSDLANLSRSFIDHRVG